MASGGHHNDGKELRQKIDSTSNGNNLGDRPASLPWPSLPNNLELNTKSKHTKKKRNKEKVEEQASSAAAVAAKRNIKVPVNQRQQQTFQRTSSKSSMEHENNSQPKEDSKYKHVAERENAVRERLTHLQDCIAQVNSLLQHLKQSDEPNEADVSNDEADESDPESPFVAKPPEGYPAREASGRAMYITEEDKANIQNHLLEKMKTSQEKLTALKQQQTMLLTMRRNAEEKLAAFQAELAKNGLEGPSAREWQYPPEASSADAEDPMANGEVCWKSAYNCAPHAALASQNTQKVKNGQKNFLSGTGDSNTQELTTLHANLEHIKRRLEILQVYSDDRNVAEPSSPGEVEIDQNLSNRLLAVEWQRKKLKNRLLELQEKKKASDELMKELSLIKEAANAVENLNGMEDSVLPNVQDLPMLSLYDENEGGALEAMQETISQLRGMLSAHNQQSPETETAATAANFPTASAQETLVKQNSYRVSPGKRDNIKKGQGDQFPARRHYEAEGRANEDPDVPAGAVAAAAAAPAAVVAAASEPAWDKDQKKSSKRKGIHNKQELLQAMFDCIKGKVGRMPSAVLQAISLLDVEVSSDDDTETDNEDSPENDDSSLIVERKELDAASAKIKEEPLEVSESLRQPDEDERVEASANIDELHNLEQLKNDRDRIMKLHEKFTRVRPKFSSPKQNNEEHRSRAEGGNLQKKKTRATHAISVTNPLPLQQHRQDNLLTRQNVATVESQSRNNSSNLARGSNPSLKKDNINDLSAKYNQSASSSIRGSSDLLCKYRTEMKGQELQDPHHKSHFVDIMKQDRNKLQNYSRNRDVQVHSNSSVNSEPLDGSSSAMAPDTTVAATWGGSSTQENFEDENEPFESLEEQEEEEEESNNEDAMVISNSAENSMNDNMLTGDPILASVPKSYGSALPYSKYSADSSSKRRDNRLHKYFKSTQFNQWNPRKNFPRPGFQRVQHASDTNREFSAPDDAQVQVEEASQTSAGSLNSTNPMPMPDKFIERLHLQLEKLNALCRPVLQDPVPSLGMTCQPILPQSGRDGSILSNTQYPLQNSLGRLPQAGPDLMQSYAQQLQLQQQLLLSLSHCYHALYVQQLEIHHLQRCLAQGTDSEVPAQPLNPPVQSAEDFTLRPWFLNPWLGSAVPFPPSQVSPMSAPPFMQQSQSAFNFSPNVQVPSTGATSAPRALVTSIQPARAVVHPAAQDSRTSSETLNNQVPPRTRANNFLDNFRSYSRQNLLSSTNVTKGKEGSTTTGGPQVRQVHPLVPNESNWSHRSRVFIPPHTENSVSTTTTTTTTAPVGDVRSFVRPISNSDCQGTTAKSKKPNLSRPHVTQSVPDSSTGTIVSTFSSCPEPDQSYRPLSDDGACAERCAKSRTSTSAVLSPSAQPIPDSIHAEVSRFLAQNSNQEGILEEFFHELRNIKADSLPRVLGAVKDVANSERSMFVSSAVRHPENDGHAIQDRPELGHSADNRVDTSSSTVSSSGDLNALKLACENACQRSNQNWPPATIIPLGKHIPKPSTGAVKKRPAAPRESALSASSSTFFSSATESQSAENKVPARADSLEGAVERVILELIPFIQCHNMDDCCTSLRANFAAKIIDTLKSNTSLKLSPEFLAQLRQTLIQVTSKYASFKWFECEGDLVKTIAGTLFQEMSLYKSMSARLSADESGDHSAKNPPSAVLPSSSKTFVEAHKQIIPNKDHREISVETGSTSFPVQEFENNVADIYINMPSQESNMPNHCNGNSQHEPVRGAVGGNCSPPVSSWQNHVVSAEEDACYEFDPEAEGEPEVEAGTEADLAEADQSPAPQNAVNGMPGAEFHAPQPCLSHLSHIISEENVCNEGSASVDNVLSLNLSAQAACNSNPEKEITLDDVPIKLAPMSQEELQRQMAEEQSSNLLLVAQQLDGTEDLPLAGSGETLKDPPTFI